MNTIIKTVATLLIFLGVIWLLQGLGVLPGSVMTGDTKWAVIGAASVIAGVAAWAFAARRR
jgi:hypothetical protein